MARGGVDLVLLDLHLPDGSGLDLFRRIRAAGSTVDVMVVSSARDADVVRSAVAQGAVQYVIKPFAFGTLRDRLLAYQEFRNQVAGDSDVDQAAVDRALGMLRSPVGETLPKGMTKETLAIVVGALREFGEASATQIADFLGVSRITARRYLEHLADTNVAEREPAVRAGRPAGDPVRTAQARLTRPTGPSWAGLSRVSGPISCNKSPQLRRRDYWPACSVPPVAGSAGGPGSSTSSSGRPWVCRQTCRTVRHSASQASPVTQPPMHVGGPVHAEIQPGQPDGQRRTGRRRSPPRSAARGERIDGSNTTSTTPRMAADASAWPDGNDSLVSVTSRYSTGGRSRPTVALPTRDQQSRAGGDHRDQHGVPAAPLDQQVPRWSRAAMIVIDTVLPTSVTTIATVVSAGVRWSTIHCQTMRVDGRPDRCSRTPRRPGRGRSPPARRAGRRW